jgi:peptidyl-prolyl cis-trans isomerase SurA
MNALGRLLLFLVALHVIASASQAEREVVDRIVAVVGDEAILASELAGQIQLVALQVGRQPKNEQELKQLQEEILEGMISDKLFLIEAEKDTSIAVRPEEVDQALDEHVARIAQNFSSEEAFLEALAQEGLTLRDLKKQYRDDVKNQLMKQRLVQKKLYSISISRHEVEQFYNQYKDSIPLQPEAVKLAHILLTFEPSQQVEDSVEALAADLRTRVLEGADFATISTQYSSLGAGENGGDLGYVARDDVVPEFARAAFGLQTGDISGVVRTQFGYHVIKCEGQREDRLRLRHILLAVQPSPEDSSRTYQLADSLLTELRSGAEFEVIAKKFSDDNDTRAEGGELGWFATGSLPPEFADAVSGWTTPGEIRGPVVSRFGLHILRLLEYQPERQYSLENDFDRLKELARQSKTDEVVDEWIAKIRTVTYIDYRLENQ